jgi:hypothetical protein
MHVPLRNGSYYHCCAAKRRHASGTENSCKEKSCAGREQAIGSMSPCAYWLARPLTAADLQRYPYWRCMALGGDSKVLESVSKHARRIESSNLGVRKADSAGDGCSKPPCLSSEVVAFYRSLHDAAGCYAAAMCRPLPSLGNGPTGFRRDA